MRLCASEVRGEVHCTPPLNLLTNPHAVRRHKPIARSYCCSEPTSLVHTTYQYAAYGAAQSLTQNAASDLSGGYFCLVYGCLV